MRENAELRQSMAQVAGSAGIAGALMVLLGFWFFRTLVGASESPIYNSSITVFLVLLRGGGILMLVIAAAAYAGWRPVLAIDGVATTLMGGLMVVIAIIWIAKSDLDGVFMLLFGGLFVRSGLNSWRLFRCSRAAEPAISVDAAPPVVEDGPEARPIAEASGRPGLATSLRAARKQTEAKNERVAMPKASEPDPEGFLADLGRSSEDGKH